jgi:copper chaperone
MKTELLKITGMTCAGCTSSVTKALKTVPGVGDVNVSLPRGEATVHYDGLLTSPARLNEAVINAGYGIQSENPALSAPAKGGCCGC